MPPLLANSWPHAHTDMVEDTTFLPLRAMMDTIWISPGYCFELKAQAAFHVLKAYPAIADYCDGFDRELFLSQIKAGNAENLAYLHTQMTYYILVITHFHADPFMGITHCGVVSGINLSRKRAVYLATIGGKCHITERHSIEAELLSYLIESFLEGKIQSRKGLLVERFDSVHNVGFEFLTG